MTHSLSVYTHNLSATFVDLRALNVECSDRTGRLCANEHKQLFIPGSGARLSFLENVQHSPVHFGKQGLH